MSKPIPHNDPDYWMRCMRSGDFESAWKFSDEQLKARAGKPTWHLPRHFQSIWNGEPLDGKKVLVRCYHGLGDTIQFIRFMPMLKAIAQRVIVWAQLPLIPLLQTVEGIDELEPLHDGAPTAEYDADIEIMELAHYFRITPNTIPQTIPYLTVEPLRLNTSNQKPIVGLVWKPGDWDQLRCIPYPELEPLNSLTNIQLVILQANAAGAGWQAGFGLHPGEFTLHDYARVIAGLDLLISVDSMPVHMAGALGVPVWNLLHSKADWRWMDGRKDSPWYPTMRIFRQPTAGDWSSVIAAVMNDLKLL